MASRTKDRMTHHDVRLIAAIEALGRISVLEGTIADTLHRVAVLADETVAGSAMVGLTLEIDSRLATPVFTDEDAPEVDAEQYRSGAGPGLDAYRHARPYRIDSTREERRWPEFAAACVTRGILSTLSLPIGSAGEVVGAVNFYARDERAFGASDEEVAARFAVQAATVIVNTRAYWDARELGEQLTEALASRVVIERAKGVLMAAGHTGDEAFDLLRRASQRENRKVRLVADDVVAEAERRARSRREPAT